MGRFPLVMSGVKPQKSTWEESEESRLSKGLIQLWNIYLNPECTEGQKIPLSSSTSTPKAVIWEEFQ